MVLFFKSWKTQLVDTSITYLLNDMYGNYVLQKVMNLSKEPLTNKYISYIGPLMKNLSNYSFGSKLYNKLISSFPCLSNYVSNKNDPISTP